MNDVRVKFLTTKAIEVDVRPVFDTNAVADAFDKVLHEKSAHAINRLLRMFKLRNKQVFQKVRTILRNVTSIAFMPPHYLMYDIAYNSEDYNLNVNIYSSEPIQGWGDKNKKEQVVKEKEKKEEEEDTEKTSTRCFRPARALACICIILGFLVVYEQQSPF